MSKKAVQSLTSALELLSKVSLTQSLDRDKAKTMYAGLKMELIHLFCNNSCKSTMTLRSGILLISGYSKFKITKFNFNVALTFSMTEFVVKARQTGKLLNNSSQRLVKKLRKLKDHSLGQGIKGFFIL